MPLAYFLLSQQADLSEQEVSSAREEACVRIQQALTMFPGGECALQPQARVGPTLAQLPMMHLKATCALRASVGLRVSSDIDSSSRACHLKRMLPGRGH